MMHRMNSRLACVAVAFASLIAVGPVEAQRYKLKSDKTVLAAFRPVVEKPSQSTVQVMHNDKQTALGTVVGEDGWIVTKASEVPLGAKVSVKLRNGKSYDATIHGVEEKHDLAMLKIDVKGLTPVAWAASKSAEVGDWLAAPGLADDPVAIGVVSVAAREPKLFEMPAPAPKADSGFMGVQLGDDEGSPTIGRVEPKSAAEKAGLKVGDVVLSVQGEKVVDVERLIAKIQTFKAGDIVTLKIKRGDKEQDVEVTLGKRPSNQPNRGDMQNSMGSKLSTRRGGFPAILQSDLIIPHDACGGPAVTLGGKAVGVFIARAGRTESYVIPSERVQGLITDLKSGKLKPKEPVAVVNIKDLEEALAKAKTAVEAKQKELKAIETPNEPTIRKLSAELAVLKKKQEEAQKKLDSARKDTTKKKE